MQHYLNNFLFAYYPYICMLVFVAGSIARYEYAQYGWRSSSSQLLRNKGMQLGNNLFHIGIILLFVGHLVGLLMPKAIYTLVMTSATKQMMAMVAGGIFGTICFIGMSILVYRRLFDPRIRKNSSFADIAILLLIYVQLILGLITIPVSAQHLDGSSMVALSHWAQHVVTFQSGAASFIVGQSIIFKLHIVLGLTIFLVFPFTRLVHVLSAPIGYLFRAGHQIVRKRA